MNGGIRGRVHDFLRSAIAAALRLAGIGAGLRLRLRLRFRHRTEARLRQRYRITADTPLTRDLPAPADGAPLAITSGTAGSPRQVAYPRNRLRAVRRTFEDAMLRLIAAHRIRRPSLYVFGPLRPDRSLTRLLVAEPRPPPGFVLLQAPYRAQSDPAILRLADEYGDAALRLLLLTLSNPGILYATNPSTLSTFFDELDADWERASALARTVSRSPPALDPAALRILRRLRSTGDSGRLARLAASPAPLPITAWAPAAAICVCWTGGAVRPFLDRLDRRLPAPRFCRIPMFSMSTETVETIPDFRGPEPAFLPFAPGVLHEFLDQQAANPRLLSSGELQPGGIYEMVVSHRFGLTRYATGDLFRVARLTASGPDLRFARRRLLGWSFTGEKITAQQVGSAFDAVDAAWPGLRTAFWLALFPEDPGAPARPGYRLAAVGRGPESAGAQALPPGLEGQLDALLSEQNPEYRAKRESGRLGPIRLAQPSLVEFVRRASGERAASPDSQFKFQPFYPRQWEAE